MRKKLSARFPRSGRLYLDILTSKEAKWTAIAVVVDGKSNLNMQADYHVHSLANVLHVVEAHIKKV